MFTNIIFFGPVKNLKTLILHIDVDNESGEIISRSWRTHSVSTSNLPLLRIGRKSGGNPKAIRDELATYFTNEHGSIP